MSKREPSTVMVIASTVLAALVLVAYVVLAALDRLPERNWLVFGAVLVAVLPTVAGQAATYGRLGKVERQTNGAYARQLDVIQRQSELLARANPLPPDPAPPARPDDYPTRGDAPER